MCLWGSGAIFSVVISCNVVSIVKVLCLIMDEVTVYEVTLSIKKWLIKLHMTLTLSSTEC